MEHWLGIFIALYVGSRAIDTFTRYGPQPEKTVDDHGHGHGGDKKTVEMPYLAPSGAEEAGKAFQTMTRRGFENFTGKAFIFFNTIFNDTDKRNSILDPFTCIIRLAILSFKPVGTKISIHNNKISYHDPNILQGALRWTYGDNREDLHNIYNPIRKVIES